MYRAKSVFVVLQMVDGKRKKLWSLCVSVWSRNDHLPSTMVFVLALEASPLCLLDCVHVDVCDGC